MSATRPGVPSCGGHGGPHPAAWPGQTLPSPRPLTGLTSRKCCLCSQLRSPPHVQRLLRAAVSAPAGPGTGTSMRDASARVALPGPPESSLICNTRDQRRLRTPCTAFGERSSLRPLSRECRWVPPRPSLAVLSLRCSDAHLSLRPVTDTDESLARAGSGPDPGTRAAHTATARPPGPRGRGSRETGL